MPQYPNDPGMDRHHHHDHAPYHPDKDIDILTTDNFVALMRLQTQYSYEGARQLANKAVEHSDQQYADMTHRIKETGDMFDGEIQKVNASIDEVSKDAQMANACVVTLKAQLKELTDFLKTRMTERDCQALLNEIYSVA